MAKLIGAAHALSRPASRPLQGFGLGSRLRAGHSCRSRHFQPRAAGDFNLSDYHEATISDVRHTDNYGHVIFLRIKDTNSMLPVYIGDFECGALLKEINKKPSARPLTHDLMKNMVEAMGFRVTKVRVTALVGNTYHARVHLCRTRGSKEEMTEVDVDARPSDAINLAVRFGATIYVNKDIAARMARNRLEEHDESQSQIVRSCKEEIMAYQDPTIMHKLQMQLAIAEERFDDAAQLRDQIDKVLASDRALSLVVAIETALEDGRYEEAARLRDQFRALKDAQQRQQQQQEGGQQSSPPSGSASGSSSAGGSNSSFSPEI